jgi:Zn-dependent metalloprotease
MVLTIAAAAALILAFNAAFAAPGPAQADPLDRLQRQSDGRVRLEVYEPTGVARLIEAEAGALTREFAGGGRDPESIARAFLQTYGALFGLTDQGAELALKMVQADDLGMQHVRFTQRAGELSVFGADLIVHLDADGAVLLVNGYVVPGLAGFDRTPVLSAEQAAAVAISRLGVPDSYAAEKELTILNTGLIIGERTPTYLTYRILASSYSQPHLAQWIFVDARTGDVRFAYAAAEDSRNRNTYNMQHGTNYSAAILARTETQPPVSSAPNCTPTDVNNAHDYAGDTYDFYFNRFGRDSYNNAGATLNSYVCYGSGYQNAFWDGSKMTYGDGFAAADDVVAHELSHGVTQYTSNLVYSYQSGALNESYSDIFGESVDLTNTGGNDSPSVRWLMGEDIPGIGAIRNLMNPPQSL